MPDGTEVIRTAAAHGWEAGLLALVMIGSFAFLAWLIKSWMVAGTTREERMANRLDVLEDFQRTELKMLVVQCTKTFNDHKGAVDRLTDILQERPCLLPK